MRFLPWEKKRTAGIEVLAADCYISAAKEILHGASMIAWDADEDSLEGVVAEKTWRLDSSGRLTIEALSVNDVAVILETLRR